jgi:hypothetical protein
MEKEFETLRTYSLNNFYFSGIHAGNQSAHSHDELTVKYFHPILDGKGEHLNKNSVKILKECQKLDKTMIVINGGMQIHLENVLSFLEENEDNNDYPFAPFYEAKEATNGTLTNISIVLPEKIYVFAPIVDRCITLMRLEQTRSLNKPKDEKIMLRGGFPDGYSKGNSLHAEWNKDGSFLLKTFHDNSEILDVYLELSVFEVKLMQIIASKNLM